MAAQRDTLLAQTFVDVADTLVADFDVLDFLTLLTTRCVELFDLAEAGLLLGNGPGGVRVAASSSHEMRLLELLEIQHDEGPSLDCFRSGQAVTCGDLRLATKQWPRFATEALASGWESACALPMRLRDDTIGSLNLLRAHPGEIDPADLVAAQALADVATIGILQQRAVQQSADLAEQLQTALNNRLIIEQAKGVLAERERTDMAASFDMLRFYARRNRAKLSDVARAVVEGGLDSAELRRAPRPSPTTNT